MFGKRILILVPHPDDEVVAAAAAVGRAQKEGAHLFALYLTDGCIARETLWPWQRQKHEAMIARRRREAEQVAAHLHLTAAGWSARPARHLWRDLPDVLREIETALARFSIDQVWLPAYEGGNPDHDALNALGSLLKPRVSVLEFAEYNFKDGKTSAQTFPEPNGTETILMLTEEERKTKRALLALYRSEQGNLAYVGTMHECFRPLASYDYSLVPHEGILWYARFQWVPFRHPRVDFTKPADVSAALMSFLNAKASGLPAPATQQGPGHKGRDRGTAA